MLSRASKWSRQAAAATRFAAPAPAQVASTSYAIVSVEPASRNRGPLAASRPLCSTSARTMPRQLPRRTVQEERPDERTEPVAAPPSNVGDELSGTDPAIPWFLQTEIVDAPAEPPSELEASEASEALQVDTPTNTFSYIPLAPKVTEPAAIGRLKAHLASGPSANLIARPSDEADQLTPVTLIHPASLSKDPSADAYGANDWIVVVQVKSSAAGSVRRVALDIGRLLKHTRPPALESELDLDDFLGPDRAPARYRPASTAVKADAKAEPTTPRPKGVSRIEHELGKKLPEWAVHRIALQRKFPEGWRPPKILSREAQEGIRLLHASDPEQFDVVELSARFRVSVEGIRRILRARWTISGEARSRQDRRAAERAAARESTELAEIRRLEAGELVEEGESPEIEEPLEEEMDEDEGEGWQTVRYEGLVMSAADAASLGVTNRLKAGGKKGDGNWCLVDADWCMVHVMTETARFNYDIEGIWRELEAGKQSKPKPWEEQAGPGEPAVRSRPRTHRDLFGERLSKKRGGSARETTGTARFGDSRRFGTTAWRAAESATMATQLASAHEALERGEEAVSVCVSGWLRSTRKQKAITFLELSDGSLLGSRTLQAVVRSSTHASASVDRLAGLTVGTAVRLHGELRRGRGSKPGQQVELDVSSIQVLSPCDADYPLAAVQLQQNSATVDEGGYSASLAERRNAHLLGRLARYAAVARTRERLERGIATYLSGASFVKIACPVLTSSDCEGAGEVFEVQAAADVERSKPGDFWSGTRAYLTVSSQLHLEAAGLGLGRVWTLNPAFRAERSATNRHLAEFWMVEVEMYFAQLAAILDTAERMIKCAIAAALEGGEDMAVLADAAHLAALQAVAENRWSRITYHEALQLLKAAPHGCFEVEPTEEGGLASEHEKYLAKDGPVFVTHYPLHQKAFYMKRYDGEASQAPRTVGTGQEGEKVLVECFDLLIPGLGELVGGSVREHRTDVLQDNLERLGRGNRQGGEGGEGGEGLGWYTSDLRRFGGAVPHAGFGLGLERLLAWISHTASVKDVVPFPRVKGPIRF